MMRSNALHGWSSSYGHESSHGLGRSSRYPSQQPGDKSSALRTQHVRQDNFKAPNAFPTDSVGRILGGAEGNHVGSPSAQAANAAEKRRLQLGEQMSSNRTSSQALGSTVLSSVNPLSISSSSGTASIHNNLPIFGAGAFSVQAQMSGGGVPVHLFDVGNAYNMGVQDSTAQPFFGLPASSATRANDIDGDDIDMDMDDDFLMPFPSP